MAYPASPDGKRAGAARIGDQRALATVGVAARRDAAAGSFSACQPDLVTLLTQLHRQPLSGYRLRLLPLLQHYWLQCRHRHPRWLRQLKRLARRGEPPPLRLGLLHMDIHPGNLLTQPAGLRLIDWEYAADGDVALELAAIIDGNGLNAAQGDALLAAYARANRIAPAALRRQAARWRPGCGC